MADPPTYRRLDASLPHRFAEAAVTAHLGVAAAAHPDYSEQVVVVTTSATIDVKRVLSAYRRG